MAKQKIPRITPYMISQQPDQVAVVLNLIIDRLNEE